MARRRRGRVAPLVASAWLSAASAGTEPFVPGDDAEIIERLPRAAVAVVLARSGRNAGAPALTEAIERARELVALARSEGDLRYLGYAEGLLAPWWSAPERPAAVRLVKARVLQSRHDFDAALGELHAVLEAHPGVAEAWLVKALVEQARGEYADARRSCAALHRRASPLVVAVCLGRLDGLTGAAARGSQRIAAALARSPHADPALRQWALQSRAELAHRRGESGLAERLFRAAAQAAGPDVALLASHADLLVDAGRHADALALLADAPSTDALLLRRARSERALGLHAFREHRDALAARFAAARRHGLRTHLREQAEARLHLDDRPREALALALEGWATHREPADARIVLEAALAAGEPAAALPVARWLARHGTEGPVLDALARRTLGAVGS